MHFNGTSSLPPYERFQEMTESLVTTLEEDEVPPSDFRIARFVVEWMEFYRNNKTVILDQLNQKAADAAPFRDQISFVHRQHYRYLSHHVVTSDVEDSILKMSALVDQVSKTGPKSKVKGEVDKQAAVLFALPADVLQVALGKLSSFKDLVRAGTINQKIRSSVLNIAAWKQHPSYQAAVQQPDYDLFKQFLEVLKLYGGSKDEKSRNFAKELATAFFFDASEDSLRCFLRDNGIEGRAFLHDLLKDVDLGHRRQLTLTSARWLHEDKLTLKFLLQKCPSLTSLRLDAVETLFDEDLKNCPAHLSSFSCEACPKVEGLFLQTWPNPSNLQSLNLSGCKAFQATHLAKNLPKFTHLHTLELRGLKLTDEDLAFLPKLNQLEKIDLSQNPALTDNTLKALAAIPTLKTIVLKGNKGLTSAAIRDLKTNRPNIVIET